MTGNWTAKRKLGSTGLDVTPICVGTSRRRASHSSTVTRSRTIPHMRRCAPSSTAPSTSSTHPTAMAAATPRSVPTEIRCCRRSSRRERRAGLDRDAAQDGGADQCLSDVFGGDAGGRKCRCDTRRLYPGTENLLGARGSNGRLDLSENRRKFRYVAASAPPRRPRRRKEFDDGSAHDR